MKKGQALARLGDQGQYQSPRRASICSPPGRNSKELRANAPKETADHQALIQAKDAYEKAKTLVQALKHRASETLERSLRG